MADEAAKSPSSVCLHCHAPHPGPEGVSAPQVSSEQKHIADKLKHSLLPGTGSWKAAPPWGTCMGLCSSLPGAGLVAFALDVRVSSAVQSQKRHLVQSVKQAACSVTSTSLSGMMSGGGGLPGGNLDSLCAHGLHFLIWALGGEAGRGQPPGPGEGLSLPRTGPWGARRSLSPIQPHALLCCSTLLVKQKLPGVYVQPSYRSALGKPFSSRSRSSTFRA